jgi:hypothetical protein
MLGIKPDDQLIAEPTAEGLLLRPAMTFPVETYSHERIIEFDAAEADLAVILDTISIQPSATSPDLLVPQIQNNSKPH